VRACVRQDRKDVGGHEKKPLQCIVEPNRLDESTCKPSSSPSPDSNTIQTHTNNKSTHVATTSMEGCPRS
jgi:hypothetical protein